MTATPHLKIEGLRTYFYSKEKQAFVRSVDGVDLSIERGETLGVVGESGSGKSVTMLSVMGLINSQPGVVQGQATLQTDAGERQLLAGLEDYVRLESDGGNERVSKDIHGWQRRVEANMVGIRGKELGMIFQNPKAALNPYATVGKQISEIIRLHTGITNTREAKEKAIEWLARVKIDSPRERYDNYPYGLSGGMCQRVMIAMALAAEPSLLIADEPTTGLDATIQSKVMDLLAELKSDLGITMVLISHDISVISRLSDRVAVMYGGTVMEHGPAEQVLLGQTNLKHPYTKALLGSIPSKDNVTVHGRLPAIEGEVPDTIQISPGCRFYGRCRLTNDSIEQNCRNTAPTRCLAR